MNNMNEKIIAWLMKINQNVDVTRVNTNNSSVLVGGHDFVYRIFTGVNSTAEQLSEARNEIYLNRPLAPNRYLDGAKSIIKVVNGKEEDSLELLSLESGDPRAVVGYILKMRQYKADESFAGIVKNGQLSSPLVRTLGRTVGKHHIRLLNDLTRSGDTTTIDYLETMLDAELNNFIGNQEVIQLLDCIKLRLNQKRTPITHTIYSRVGCVGSVHGDMRLHNIVLIDEEINILNMQYGEGHDVAKDVGDILAGFYFYGRYDLVKAFLGSYIHATGNNTINFVINYWVAFASFRNGVDLLGRGDKSSNKMGVSYLKQAIEMLERIE